MRATDDILQASVILVKIMKPIYYINHEFENVQKCLAGGFVRLAVIATGRKRLDDIAAAVQSGLGPEAAAKVSCHDRMSFWLNCKNWRRQRRPFRR
jgi:hypothetical protein